MPQITLSAQLGSSVKACSGYLEGECQYQDSECHNFHKWGNSGSKWPCPEQEQRGTKRFGNAEIKDDSEVLPGTNPQSVGMCGGSTNSHAGGRRDSNS